MYLFLSIQLSSGIFQELLASFIVEIALTIRKLERVYGFAKLGELISELDDRGIDEKRARAAIEQLRSQGDIFEPVIGGKKLHWMSESCDLFESIYEVIENELFLCGFLDIHNVPEEEEFIIRVQKVKNVDSVFKEGEEP